MRRFTIRRLMLAIALVAGILGGFCQLARMNLSGHTERWRRPCESNLRNIVLGLIAYANVQGAFPSGTWPHPSLPPEKRLSWYAAILMYLDQQELSDQLDRSKPWDADSLARATLVSNDIIACTYMSVLNCPDSQLSPLSAPVPTQYIGIAGLGADAPSLPSGHARAGVFGYERQTTIADIKDGLSLTMIVAESGRVRGSWLAGGPATVRGLDTAERPYVGPGRQFGGMHYSGMFAVFADGSVRFVSDSINPRVLEAVSTIAGDEPLPAIPFE